MRQAHTVLYQERFWIQGIMCHRGCGAKIDKQLAEAFTALQTTHPFLVGKELRVFPEAVGLGTFCYTLSIVPGDTVQDLTPAVKAAVDASFTQAFVDAGRQVVPVDSLQQTHQYSSYWLNPCINAIAFVFLITLWAIFPPSLYLMIGLSALTLLSITITGRDFFIGFLTSVFNPNRDLALMDSAITVAWLVSVAHMAYHVSNAIMHGMFMLGAHPFMMLGLFFIINMMDIFKQKIAEKTTALQLNHQQAFLPLQDSYQRVTENGAASEVIAKQRLNIGDQIIVEHGACFPADCCLLSENAWLNTVIIDGESKKKLQRQADIFAGSINIGAAVNVEITESPAKSALTCLLQRANRDINYQQLLQDPQREKYVMYLYFSLIALSFLLAIFLPYGLGILTLSLALKNITGLLFAVCPCVLAIAQQLPSLSFLYARAQHDIIVNQQQFVDQHRQFDTIIFDKTGTLTSCHVASSTINDSALLAKIHAIENQLGKHHPIGDAIISHTKSDQCYEISESEVSSNGIKATIDGKEILVGNREYLGSLLPPQPLSQQGDTIVYVAKAGQFQGTLTVAHTIRPGIAASLQQLKNNGKRLVMITGDQEQAACQLNHDLGGLFEGDDIHHGKKPAEKEAVLTKILKTVDPQKTVIVGDGINDSQMLRFISSKGGVSCAINHDTSAACFSDIMLNGRLDYLLAHSELTAFTDRIKTQNQLLMIGSAIAINAVLIGVSIAGFGLPMLLPIVLILLTTLFSLANCCRIPLQMNQLMKQHSVFSQVPSKSLPPLAVPVCD